MLNLCIKSATSSYILSQTVFVYKYDLAYHQNIQKVQKLCLAAVYVSQPDHSNQTKSCCLISSPTRHSPSNSRSFLCIILIALPSACITMSSGGLQPKWCIGLWGVNSSLLRDSFNCHILLCSSTATNTISLNYLVFVGGDVLRSCLLILRF